MTYVHIEWCPECGLEVSYETPNPFVAVRCPTEGCNQFHIHCSACHFFETPAANGGDCGNCPWGEEACPSSGEMVPVFYKYEGKFTCPACGEKHTVQECIDSWEV